MTDENKKPFETEEPIEVPLTTPQDPIADPKPVTKVKGGIDKVGGTYKGMTTESDRFIPS